MKTYQSYSDPGHGWLKVPRQKLVELGILNKVSSFSYQRKEFVYLEEDCDASLFASAMKIAGEEWTDKGHSTRDRQSKIRSYEPFTLRFSEKFHVNII